MGKLALSDELDGRTFQAAHYSNGTLPTHRILE